MAVMEEGFDSEEESYKRSTESSTSFQVLFRILSRKLHEFFHQSCWLESEKKNTILRPDESLDRVTFQVPTKCTSWTVFEDLELPLLESGALTCETLAVREVSTQEVIGEGG